MPKIPYKRVNQLVVPKKPNQKERFICTKCKQEVFDKDTTSEYKGQRYHVWSHTCKACSETFITLDDRITVAGLKKWAALNDYRIEVIKDQLNLVQ